ncbi:hypothetical protein [Streptomyces griseofuscus]|uniref:hypothetical protein n=1 Tax=Streptomyces griseofuscus TaxID=146922 RepID=UPI0037BD88BA
MTTKPASTTGTPQLTTFQMRFTSTPRGARLARRLAAVRLDEWGILYGTAAYPAGTSTSVSTSRPSPGPSAS